GIAYPHTGAGHPGNGEVIYALTGPWLEQQFARAQTIILSHELLFAQAPRAQRLRTLADRLNIHVDIIAFLRPFDEVILGDYSQNLRQNLTGIQRSGRAFQGRSFRQFAWARQKDIQPAQFLSEWQAALPSAQLHLHHHTDIKPALIGLLPQMSQLDWHVPVWRSNPSLSRTACADLIQTTLSQRHENASIPRAGTASQTAPTDDQRMRAWLRAIFKPQRRALIDTFAFDVNARTKTPYQNMDQKRVA
ncbi:MAG: hypothetical protein AAGH17_07165, partial [Pseudomonadota bacterium]